MSESDAPQIYLATPAQIDLQTFRGALAAVLDAVPVACFRIALASRDEDVLSRTADVLREVAHARDVPLVIDDHHRLAEKTGLDGVHLSDGARRVRDVRRALGTDAIVGAFCGTSSHVGMTAGENGADYVAFGPVSQSELLETGPLAEPELFAWWAEMIEVPVVAEGGLVAPNLAPVAAHADFLCFGEEIWAAPDPVAAAKAIAADLAAQPG